MNVGKLKALENTFLNIYPEGFESEDMIKEAKKHKVDQVSEYWLKVCKPNNLNKGIEVIPDIIKFMTKSSMVSVFEKIKFRDIIKELTPDEKIIFVDSIKELLYGNEEDGFTNLVFLLKPYKLAKWTIISAFKAYFDMDYEVFMKPTTVKKIIKYLELEDMTYNATPSFCFYSQFRAYINELKKHVDKKLSPNNPAFTGFLMFSIE